MTVYDESVYWIWLQQCLGEANAKVKLVRDYYDSAYDFYNKVLNYDEHPAGFSEKDIITMRAHGIDEALRIFDQTLSRGYSAVSYNDRDYPASLRAIDTPPAVLYVWGDLSCLKSSMAISAVGTRTPKKEHYDLAYAMCRGFAQNNVTVVSGGALGIDTAAHQGALSVNGSTVAVLGCGLDFPYLTVNESMRKSISKNGAVISEYPVGTSAAAKHFPIRNRIIAALGIAAVMVQGRENSGTMITVNYAMKYNKKIFAVPGNPADSLNSGNNSLIANGARPVTNYKEVLRCFFPLREIKTASEDKNEKIDYVIKNEEPRSAFEKRNTQSAGRGEQKEKRVKESAVNESMYAAEAAEKNNDKNTNNNAEKIIEQYCLIGASAEVLRCLGDASSDIDEIVTKTKLNVSDVLSALTELEIFQIVEKTGSRNYKIR